jgi:hypothetical protein
LPDDIEDRQMKDQIQERLAYGGVIDEEDEDGRDSFRSDKDEFEDLKKER